MKPTPLLVLLAAALVPAAPAPAQDLSSPYLLGRGGEMVGQWTGTARVSGELVVTWTGDAATCAGTGRCDHSGTIAWRPARRGSLQLLDLANGRRRGILPSLLLDADDGPRETYAHTLRRRAGGSVATCSDSTSPAAGLDARVVGDEIVFGVRPDGPGPLASRCAGPVWRDLRWVLPQPRLAIGEVRRRGAVADLRTAQTFTAGGLRGTVRSTLVLRVSPLRGGRPDTEADDDEDDEPFRITRWRIASVTGSLRADVAGDPSPARCAGIDACGLTGAVTVTPRPRAGELTAFLSERPVDGSRLFAAGGWHEDGSVAATLSRPDASAPCVDSTPLVVGHVLAVERGGRVEVTYSTVPEVTGRCGGPVFGGVFETAASGAVPLRAFRRSRRVTVRLTRGESRTAAGFRVSTAPDLTLVLVRR